MFPDLFIQRIKTQFSDADAFIDALNNPAVTSIRKHPLKGKNVKLGNDEIPWCNNAYYLNKRPVFTLDPYFHTGAYYVQESSSMFIHYILENLFSNKNIRVLDLCAAPGGKSTLIASWLNREGLLVSNEVIRSRAQILLENIIKWGYANTWVTNTDVHVLGGLDEFFDCIVIDAPCSGEGLFRKDKDAIDEWSEANCNLCSKRQKKIIADILPALNVGGYCIYSTCTFNPAENDENLEWMLEEFPVELISVDASVFSSVRNTDGGGYAFYPHLSKGEGFYCCVLRKTDTIDSEHVIKKAKINWSNTSFKERVSPMVTHEEKFEFLQLNENVFGVHKQLSDEWKKITSITKVLGGYLNIGSIKGKDLIPDHALSMSIYYNNYYPEIEVDQQTALEYLAKKDIKLSSNQHGWHIIRYDSSILGLAKYLGNRINNYYPTEWRIRMEV